MFREERNPCIFRGFPCFSKKARIGGSEQEEKAHAPNLLCLAKAAKLGCVQDHECTKTAQHHSLAIFHRRAGVVRNSAMGIIFPDKENRTVPSGRFRCG